MSNFINELWQVQVKLVENRQRCWIEQITNSLVQELLSIL